MKELSRKERIVRQIRGEEVDRIPLIGGWLGGVEVLANLAGITRAEYLAAPLDGSVKAHQTLDVDGMVWIIYPTRSDEIRMNMVREQDHAATRPEAMAAAADRLPDSEAEILKSFDAKAAEAAYRAYYEEAFARWGGMEPVPNWWEISGPFPLYQKFGYEAFLMACLMYPDAVEKLWWAEGVESRERAKILCRLYREFDLAPMMFCGQDYCDNKGPLVDPAFMRERYSPIVRMVIEPLLDQGIRFVHHCDGQIEPVIDDIFDTGFTGLQGFQYELGVNPRDYIERARRRGFEPLMMMGLNVTRTLPFGTPEDVRAEVDYFFDITDGGQGLFLFTSNTTGSEVPAENLRAGYGHARDHALGETGSRGEVRWPGASITAST